ncbi:MAG: thiamine diphosphokinase [Ruminococcaceae bacterium]|nr:thiamine diphosphokinase [Oscillospiraceae bacterium]
MNAFLYVGGEIRPEGITERPAEGDLVIAADAGYHNARRLGVTPSILVGDLDSFGNGEIPAEVELIQHPPEKDYTDTQLALELALERGATSLTFIGGLSGRLDHTLSNLAVLEYLRAKKRPAIFTDGANRVRFLRNDSALIPRSQAFRYLALIAADERVRGVDVEGCKYPLKNATLTRLQQYAVSNEITGNCAFVAVKRGGLWIVESAEGQTEL